MDNGNVFQIVNNVNGDCTQNFRYDALNRIAETWTSGPLWGERFTIDLWGNLTNRDSVPGKTSYESLVIRGQTELTPFPSHDEWTIQTRFWLEWSSAAAG